MGGEGSIAGMITALRNNANMRLNRKHFFNKKERTSSNENVRIKMRHTERSPEQILTFRKNLKAQKRKDTVRMIIAFLSALSLIALLGLLVFLVL